MFLVAYVDAAFALAPLVVQQRYRMVKSFRTEAEAGAFVLQCWRDGRWRALELYEVRREGGVWVQLRPF